jgi:hypothetical protein
VTEVLIKPLHGKTRDIVKSRPLVNALVIKARQAMIGANSPGFLRQFEDFLPFSSLLMRSSFSATV